MTAREAHAARSGGDVDPADPDVLILLRALPHRAGDSRPMLTKLHRGLPDGRIETHDFDRPAWFSRHPRRAGDFDALAVLLERLRPHRDVCAIPGVPLPGMNPDRDRRLKTPCPLTGHPATYGDTARSWGMLDFDGAHEPVALDLRTELEDAVEHALGLLPEPFPDTSCIGQASASAAIKTGLRLHLWFRFSRPLTPGALKAWLKAEGAPVDRSIYHAVGICYTADPAFVGMRDPMRRRSVVRRGLVDVVEVPKVLPEPTPIVPVEVGELGEGDLKELAAAFSRSRTARQIWTGERAFSDTSSAHFALAAALARAGVRDPGSLARALTAYGAKHGDARGKLARPDYLPRTVGAALGAAGVGR